MQPSAPLESEENPRMQAMRSFITCQGMLGAKIEPLALDASFRRYYRIMSGADTMVLMDAPPEHERIDQYVKIARFLNANRYSAPSILGEDQDNGFLLLEDLGDNLFSKILREQNASEEEMYKAAVDVLIAWHRNPMFHKSEEGIHLGEYDISTLILEVSLFTDWFLPMTLGKEKANALRSDFLQIWKAILSKDTPTTDMYVHRDFHTDNLIWLKNRAEHKRVGLLDFQDALWGDTAYDMASLLEDARRDVSSTLAEEMIAYYLKNTGANERKWRTHYTVLAAQRNTKIIGIFSRLKLRDKKDRYLSYLPRVWGYLEKDLTHPALAPLKEWIDMHVPVEMRTQHADSESV